MCVCVCLRSFIDSRQKNLALTNSRSSRSSSSSSSNNNNNNKTTTIDFVSILLFFELHRPSSAAFIQLWCCTAVAQVAVRHFTHALLVLLFEALLPKEDEEDFLVSADDIRQRRKRVSSDRTAERFDLTEATTPGYDLDFLDFVVSRCRVFTEGETTVRE